MGNEGGGVGDGRNIIYLTVFNPKRVDELGIGLYDSLVQPKYRVNETVVRFCLNISQRQQF